MSATEDFDVTIRVRVKGAHGGWNPQPILGAVRRVLGGAEEFDGNAFIQLTIERVRGD